MREARDQGTVGLLYALLPPVLTGLTINIIFLINLALLVPHCDIGSAARMFGKLFSAAEAPTNASGGSGDGFPSRMRASWAQVPKALMKYNWEKPQLDVSFMINRMPHAMFLLLAMSVAMVPKLIAAPCMGSLALTSASCRAWNPGGPAAEGREEVRRTVPSETLATERYVARVLVEPQPAREFVAALAARLQTKVIRDFGRSASAFALRLPRRPRALWLPTRRRPALRALARRLRRLGGTRVLRVSRRRV